MKAESGTGCGYPCGYDCNGACFDKQSGWRAMNSAPKDGSMLRLLVRPGTGEDDGWTPFADSMSPYETIGFNDLDGTGDDEWHFAGWDWSHDCFTAGRGEVIGWMPSASPQSEASS